AKYHGADLFGAVLLVAHLDLDVVAGFDDLVAHELKIALDFFVAETAADQPFDLINRILRIGHMLAAGQLGDKERAVLINSYDRWRRASALRVRDDLSLA